MEIVVAFFALALVVVLAALVVAKLRGARRVARRLRDLK